MMPYSKLNLSNGEVLKEEHFKHLETGIASILNKFQGKRLSILGDSISTYGQNPSGLDYADGTWCYKGNLCQYPKTVLGVTDVNQMYWKIVMDELGMVYGCNDSIAGSMIAENGGTSDTEGPDKCLSSQTRINHLGMNGTPDVIIVYGGTNDIGSLYSNNADISLGTFDPDNPIVFADPSAGTPPKLPGNLTTEQIAKLDNKTFSNAIVAMLIRLQKTYPKALIVCLLPTYCTSYYGTSYKRMTEFVEMLKTICDYFGIYTIDTRKAGLSIFDKDLLPDGIHPNAEGMQLIGSYVYNQLLSHFFLPKTGS